MSSVANGAPPTDEPDEPLQPTADLAAAEQPSPRPPVDPRPLPELGASRVRPAPAGPGVGWLRRMAPFLRRYKRPLTGALVLSVVAQTLIALLPLIQKLILDDSILTEDRALGPMLTLLVVVGAAGFASNYGRRYLAAKVGVGLQHDLRLALHRHLYELDFARHDELSVGDIMSRSTADLTLIQMFFNSVPMLVANLTLVVVAITVMVVLSPVLTLVVVVFVPVFTFLAVRFRAKVFPSSWNDQRLSGSVASVVDEAVTGVRVVKAFAQEDREFDLLVGEARQLYRSRLRTAGFNARYSSTLQALPLMGQLGVLGLGGWLAINGRITPGVFLAFASYLVQLVTPVRLVSSMLSTTQQARAGAERVFELLDLEPRVQEKPGAHEVGQTPGEVRLEHVTFGYGDGPAVLRDLSLTIAPGERIGIVGASGSGKTTLAFLLARFYDPRTGTVRLDGTDVADLSLHSLRRAVSVVFEESFLFSATIRENIAFGRPDATEAEVVAAARAAQAHDFILQLADGYDTEVGERGFTLSGGQRQRIALARAALANPSVLVLDDATSAIDARTEEAIHRSFEDVLGTRTTVLIAHRHSTLRLADRVIVLEGGRIIAQGTNERLLATSPLYRELLAGPELEDDGPASVPVATIDPAAWPDDADPTGAARQSASAQLSLTAMYAGAAGGGGGMGGGIGARAGLVAASPELLRQVEALPPLKGEPDVDLPEAVAPGGKAFSRLVRRFRWALALGALLVVVDAATTLVGPLLIRHGLDDGVKAGRRDVLWATCVAFLLVQLLSWGNAAIEQLQTARTAERMLYSLRARVFAHLQRLSLDFYDKEMGGRIMTRMTTDVEALAQLLQQGLLVALTSLLTCLGVIVVLLVLDLRLALAAFTTLPLLLASTIAFQRFSQRSYLKARTAISTVNAELQESVSGVRVTQSLGRLDNNEVRFARRSEEYRDARRRSMQLMSLYFAGSQFLSTVAKAVVLGVGAHLLHAGHLEQGLLIAFLLYLDQFFSPLQQLSAVFDQWIQAKVSLGRLDELLATPTGTPERAGAIDPGHVRGDLAFEGVRFAYSPEAPEALRGVDLHVPPGDSLALVGTTGAGKSTFVKLAARFYDPTAGRVLVDGTPVIDLDLRRYRRQLGYVPQEPFLFSGTIRSNIAYGRPDASDLEVERAARAVGAHAFVASLPQGYLTPVTEGGRSMSAGQRQLLCLARAHIVDPSILILDEATSNLDLNTEAQVQQAMRRVASGRTTLLIAHRLQTARGADRIAVVDEGVVVEVGSHDELLALGGRYAELWEAFHEAGVAGEAPVEQAS